MKHILTFLAGMVGALLVIIIIKVIESILNLTMSEFLLGWMSCIGFMTGMKIYQIMKEIEPVQ